MKFNKIFALLSVVAISFQSCDKLDNGPTDNIDPTKAFRNVNDVNMGVLGVYQPLTSDLLEIGAIVSDEVRMPTENTVSNASLHRWQYNSSSGSVTESMKTYYYAINNANLVLKAIPSIPVNGTTLSTMNQYQAELLALRAYSHFEILRAYASKYDGDGMGMPYMKENSLEGQSRPTVTSNFADINTDLVTAKELMPSSASGTMRITKTAISAIQARVALYEKNWSNAIKYATEVINNQSLASKSDFSKIWIDASSSEVVWQLARESNDDHAPLGAAFYRQTGDIVLYAPSFKLINQFDVVNDIRFTNYIKYDLQRYTNSAGTKSAYLVNKYIGGNSASPGLTNVKLFRVAEMYLIRAEAEVEQNSTAGITAANADLNTLRSARINNYMNQTYTTKQAIIDAVYLERFKELAFEGHRFFDLKRRNLAISRISDDLTDVITVSQLTNQNAQYCLPIPANEMKVNKKMVQNPFYSSN